jgi:hypothetical protein
MAAVWLPFFLYVNSATKKGLHSIIPSSTNLYIIKTRNNGESVSKFLDGAMGLQHHIFEFKERVH